MTRRQRIPTPSWERGHGIGDLSGTRGQMFAIIGVIVLIVAALGIGGYALLDKYELKPRRLPGSTALVVGERRYDLREFTARTKMFVTQIGGTTTANIIIPSVDGALQAEAVVLQFASEKSVDATDDEIKTSMATALGISATDPNFDQHLQDQLTLNGLTEQQFRDLQKASVLQTKLQAAFQAALPATLESVHYRQITVADQATADNLKSQIEAGADFGALAKANSTDSTTKEAGGDAGWAPRGYLKSDVENVLFSLDINQVVTLQSSSTFTIYQVLEKDPIHAVEDAKKSTLSGNAYKDWQAEKKAGLSIQDEMALDGTGNNDKLQYLLDHAGLTTQ